MKNNFQNILLIGLCVVLVVVLVGLIVLMVTLDRETGEVLSSAQIQNGRQVTVVSVPRSELILGEGMREEASFREAEKIIGKSLW